MWNYEWGLEICDENEVIIRKEESVDAMALRGFFLERFVDASEYLREFHSEWVALLIHIRSDTRRIVQNIQPKHTLVGLFVSNCHFVTKVGT
jgi:hypothetical protein